MSNQVPLTSVSDVKLPMIFIVKFAVSASSCQFPRSLPVFPIVPIVKPANDVTLINACIRDTKSDNDYIIHSFKMNCSDIREA